MIENEVLEKYKLLVESGAKPEVVYGGLVNERVSKFEACVFLRDNFGMNLFECTSIMDAHSDSKNDKPLKDE